jgi:hypothetical protein
VKHEETLRKETLETRQQQKLAKMKNERRQFEQQCKRHMRAIFINTSLTGKKQVSARNFWVNLDHEMKIEEIHKRLKKGFPELELE